MSTGSAFSSNHFRLVFAAVIAFVFGLISEVTRADDLSPSTTESRSGVEQTQYDPPEFDIAQLPPTPESDPPTDADITNRRLASLEAELAEMKQRLSQGSGLGFGTLNPNAVRSTDIASSLYAPPATAPTPAKTVYPSVRVTGFFQADAASYSQDTNNLHQFGHIQNDSGFRRTRLAAVGDVSENVSYMLEMDFSFPGRPSFMDVWLDIQKIDYLGNVKVGQWRQPFGMDELTSVRELTFLERPLMFGMAPFRETGVGFHDNNEQKSVTWAGSVFTFPADAWGGSYGNKGGGSAARITAVPWYEEDGNQVVHFGVDHSFTVAGPAGAAYRNTNEYGSPFGSAASAIFPGTVPGGTAGATGDVPFFINTNPLNYQYANLINAEFAGVYNHFHWQSELRYSFLEGVTGNGHVGNIVIPAVYVQGAYLLTGEVRPYNKVNGVLGRITPLRPFGQCGGIGAWEVAARYDYIDFNSSAPFSAPAIASVGTIGLGGVTPISFGGGMNNVTLGVNWYLNKFAKFQINYMIGEVDRANAAGFGVSSTVNTICGRAQLDF